jgi:predicted ATPase
MYITELKIDNFRSLTGIHLRDMKRVCIFHGENNSGKSNILAALEAILRSKTITDAPAAGNEQASFVRPTEFYRGRLSGFSDNFAFGSTDPIRFVLGFKADASELETHREILQQLVAGTKTASKRLNLAKGKEHTIRATGELRYVNENTCEAFTSRIDIDNNFILYKLKEGTSDYLPSLADSDVAFDKRAAVVEAISGSLTDAFQLIGADRALTQERLNVLEAVPEFLSASEFKRSLFQLSTGRETHNIYKDIALTFNAKPFTFGELSFSIDRATERLEIMVEKSKIRLPINRLGSGVQQCLFLLSNILYRRAKMIGVEEIELNLSPTAQKTMFETIRSLVYDSNVINQALITSHSPYAPDEANVAYFEVTYSDVTNRTIVRRVTKEERKKFFSTGTGWEPDDF